MGNTFIKLSTDLNNLYKERLYLRIKQHKGELKQNHFFSLVNKKIIQKRKEITVYHKTIREQYVRK